MDPEELQFRRDFERSRIRKFKLMSIDAYKDYLLDQWK